MDPLDKFLKGVAQVSGSQAYAGSKSPVPNPSSSGAISTGLKSSNMNFRVSSRANPASSSNHSLSLIPSTKGTT